MQLEEPRRCAARTVAFRSTRLPPEVTRLRIDRCVSAAEHCEFQFHRHGNDIALNVRRKPERSTDVTTG